jgi:hypothetical protein
VRIGLGQAKVRILPATALIQRPFPTETLIAEAIAATTVVVDIGDVDLIKPPTVTASVPWAERVTRPNRQPAEGSEANSYADTTAESEE